jgi:hypothetical protein
LHHIDALAIYDTVLWQPQRRTDGAVEQARAWKWSVDEGADRIVSLVRSAPLPSICWPLVGFIRLKMVLLSSGGKVAVMVGREALPEYALKEKIEGRVTTYTCCEYSRTRGHTRKCI